MGIYFGLTTQIYDVPSDRIGKRLVSNLSAELDGIRYRKWNAERKIVFQMVIFQRVCLVTGAKNIHARINNWLDLWNSKAFNKIVNNSYAAAAGYTGRHHSNQDAEKRHHMLSNLVLHGKLRKAIIFVCERETGGVLLPGELSTNKMEVTEETAKTVLMRKHPPEKFPTVLRWRCTMRNLFYTRRYYRGCG